MTDRKAKVSAKIEQFLNRVFQPGDIVECRIILTDGTVVNGRYDNFEDLARQAAFFDDDESTKAIYYTLNPIHSDAAKRIGHWKPNLLKAKGRAARDVDISRRNLFLVDVDAKRPSNTSSTDEEKATALVLTEKVRAYLTEQGFPEPIFMDSGNGYALLYKGAGGYAGGTIWTEVLRHLDATFSTADEKIDTSVGNAARVSRLPFTMNRKGTSTEERPHRRARVVSCPATLEPVTLQALVKLSSLGALLAKKSTSDRPRRDLLIDEVGVEELIEEYQEILHLGRVSQSGDTTYFELLECPFKGAEHQGQNVGFGKTTICLTPDNIGFKCFSDDCADYTFGDLLRLLREETGRSSKVKIWDEPTFAEQVSKWGGVIDVTRHMTEEEFVRLYTQTLHKYEEKLTSTEEWQYDASTWFTLNSQEFKANAAPPDPERWGLTIEQVEPYFLNWAAIKEWELPDTEETREWSRQMLDLVKKHDLKGMGEVMGSEELFLLRRDLDHPDGPRRVRMALTRQPARRISSLGFFAKLRDAGLSIRLES